MIPRPRSIYTIYKCLYKAKEYTFAVQTQNSSQQEFLYRVVDKKTYHKKRFVIVVSIVRCSIVVILKNIQ